ncbi:hypothetical protein C1N81_21995 [Streptomyces sp. SGAir0957]
MALSICGRASAQQGRSGPKAGAQPQAEPGSPPGGAERSRVLEPVERVVTQCLSWGACAYVSSSLLLPLAPFV